jgi:tetratricopeptide (TPR) repeat protein
MHQETVRALEIDPNSSIAHVWSGDVLLRYQGDEKGALAEYEKAAQLDPLSPVVRDALSGGYLMTGALDEAIAQGRQTLQLDPNYTYLDSNLANAYREKRMFAEAFQLYLQGEESTHSPSAGLAVAYARSGRIPEALHKLAELMEYRKTRYTPASAIAFVYGALGNKDEAFAWLERAYADHDAALTTIGYFPGAAPLRDDPRFIDLVKRLGLAPEKAIPRRKR